MNATEIILIFIGIAGMVFCIIAAGQALERRSARKLALPLQGRSCPSCASSFPAEAISRARLENPFDGPSYATVVCSGCRKRWGFLGRELIEEPAFIRKKCLSK